MVGLTYFGPIIGVFVGSFVSGVLADKLVLRLARRNKGIWLSEHRLWFYLVLVIVVSSSRSSRGSTVLNSVIFIAPQY